METLECTEITKEYGNKKVLDNICLTFEKGKIYGLIGRNGAGKTTLLSVMAAQNPASKGNVTVCGLPVWENRKALDHICFAREINNGGSQNYIASLKIKEYLKIAESNFANWDASMASELIEKLELDVNQKISKLSKGMLSMVTIIVALASKADFTFLDEPVAGLDVVVRDLFYKILLEEYTETGRTFIVSTHIIDEASSIFEEVVMINKGKVMLKENTVELLERAYAVNGLEEKVDSVCAENEVYGVSKMGRSKTVTVLLEKDSRLPEDPDLSITKPSLQNLFVAMCGEQL
ncbi:MAG: ABC transporter ATP-binding protein [Treponemataceae bacterium]|nr:ABC transporter ATP-binding protein [Treponemataceae bacterium]